jgi:hypothetical protein
LGSDPSISKSQLEGGEPLPVFSHPLGEKDAFGDHIFCQFLCLREYEWKLKKLSRCEVAHAEKTGGDQNFTVFNRT